MRVFGDLRTLRSVSPDTAAACANAEDRQTHLASFLFVGDVLAFIWFPNSVQEPALLHHLAIFA
jgi:hypothetical protein